MYVRDMEKTSTEPSPQVSILPKKENSVQSPKAGLQDTAMGVPLICNSSYYIKLLDTYFLWLLAQSSTKTLSGSAFHWRTTIPLINIQKAKKQIQVPGNRLLFSFKESVYTGRHLTQCTHEILIKIRLHFTGSNVRCDNLLLNQEIWQLSHSLESCSVSRPPPSF